MYLKRKIDQYLQEWKAGENRKPLIVKGARQIGKTDSPKRTIHRLLKSIS